MFTGNTMHANRVFNRESGRSFMVALDRMLSVGPEPYAEDSESLIQSVIDAGADAMLLSPGLIANYGHLASFRGGPALVARIDFPFMYEKTQGHGEEFQLICSPKYALECGADAVVMFLTTAVKERRVFAENAAAVGKVAEECRSLSLPLIVEAVPWGQATPNTRDPELVAESARIAAELGADLVKTENLDDSEAMRHVIESCPVPVLLLGGPQLPLPELLARTQRGLEAGARGLVFGRNAWQRPDAALAMKKLKELVHSTPGESK